MASVSENRPTSRASSREKVRSAPPPQTSTTSPARPAAEPQPSTATARAAGSPAAPTQAAAPPSTRDQVQIDDPTQSAAVGTLSQGLGDIYGQTPTARTAKANEHDHGGHHHDEENPYWNGPLGTDRPNPNVDELPPDNLSDAEKELYKYRREQGPQHVKYHQGMAKSGTEQTKDWVSFFDYHKGLIDNDNKERERLGLPPLGPMDPPPPEQLCPVGKDGQPVKGPDGKVLEVGRPDPLDPKYQGKFEAFAEDMKRYHDLYHGMNPEIGHPNSNVMKDQFYEFHQWIEQQYQAWRGNNPEWTPPPA